MTYENPEDFVGSWVDTFTTDYSYENPLYGEAVLHVILGRCLINQRIQKRGSETAPRISLFYLQGPSSGKSSAYGMIYEVLDSLGIEIMSPDETTDAALVGTIEREVDEQGNEEWVEEEGVLSETEVFHFDEASVLINPKKYQENMMTYLQKALNPIGSEQNKITKKLAHGEQITVRPSCSLLLTSYMPEGIEETVLNTGFLQRMIVVPRDLTIDDRIAQTEKDIMALGEEAKESELEELINEFKRIHRFYQEPKEFSWERAKPTLVKYANDMYDQVADTPIEVRRVLEGFVPRIIEQLYRLSLHYCCMRRGTTVRSEDVRNAVGLPMTSLHMIIHWLEENPELRGQESKKTATARFRALMELIQDSEPMTDDGWYGVSGLMDDLKRVWGISSTSCYRWISVFEEKNWIRTKEIKNAKYFKMDR